MNQIEKWQEQYKTVSPTKGGYSGVRLWPCYVIITGLILFMSPYIGLFWAITMVILPAFLIAHKVATIQNSDPEGVRQYEEHIDNIFRKIEERDNKAYEAPAITKPLPQAKEAKQAKHFQRNGVSTARLRATFSL